MRRAEAARVPVQVGLYLRLYPKGVALKALVPEGKIGHVLHCSARFIRIKRLRGADSGIRHFTPGQRHCGADQAILAARHELYVHARERNPARWSGTTRNWTPIGAVTLDLERDSVVAAHSKAELMQPLAA